MAVPSEDDVPDDVGHHDVGPVVVPDITALLRDAGLRVTTMGRGPDEEPRFFSYAAAAGVVAASMT